MKNIYKWVYGFVGAMIMAWLGNFFYDRTKDIPVLNKLTSFLNWLYAGGIAVLNYQIKVWFILVALIGFWLIYRWYKFVKNASPEYTDYKKDVFKNWIWRWEWELKDNSWEPTNLTPFCPVDDVQLILIRNFYDEYFYCAKCQRKFNGVQNPVESEADAEVLLREKVNKGTYLKS